MDYTHYLIYFSLLLCMANLVVRYYQSKQEKKEKQSSPLSIEKQSSPLSIEKQSTFTNSKGEETIYIGACACTKDK